MYGLEKAQLNCASTRGRILSKWWLIAVLALTVLPARGGDLLWPLPIAPALSSSFGESRSTAFHAGIDIKTWGRTGYEVRAVDDGHIERLRTSPWGYGRAVYLRLQDGRIAVYGHLESFAPALAERIRQAQKESGRYSVDLWFKEGELSVRRGDIVAYSGESGAGPPHLHLELRDENNIPINPLLADYAIEDSTPPVFQRVGFVPFGMESQVNGQSAPTSVALRWDESAQVYATSKKVQIHGRVGINALVWDRADAATNKLAPYALKLLVDGVEVFAAAYGRVSYAEAHQVQLDRMYIDYGNGRGRFLNLFRLPGNRLDFYQGSADGLLRSAAGSNAAFLAEGEHVVEVVATDAFGNSSRARFAVVVNAVPVVAAARVTERDRGWSLDVKVGDADDALVEAEIYRLKNNKWQSLRVDQIAVGPNSWQLSEKASLWKLVVRDAKGGVDSAFCALPGQPSAALARMQVETRPHLDWVELALSFEKPLSQQPEVLSAGRALVVRQVGRSRYLASVPLDAQSAERSVVVVQLGDRRRRIELLQVAVRPGEERLLDLADGNVQLDFSSQSVYELFFPQIELFEPEVPQGLEIVSGGYALGPAVQFDKRVGVRLRYSEIKQPDQRIGLYEEVETGRWVLAGSERDGEWVEARLRTLGRFALLADVVAPQVELLQPKKNAKLKDRRPLLRARIEDLQSGIGREEDLSLELDGKLLIVEYDPEAKEIRAQPEDELAVGNHEWTVRVRDMGGNERVRKSAFRVVK
jgi:hypothetical protein